MKIFPKSLNQPRLPSELKALGKLIRRSRGVIVAGHINADGDDLASQLALGVYLEAIGKPHKIATCEAVPKGYRFIQGQERFTRIDLTPFDATEYDLMLVVDSGDLGRIGAVASLIHAGMTVVNLDHHKGNIRYGHVNIVAEKACSIGELLYYFFQYNGFPVKGILAQYLYLSIVCDTGSFRFDAMHPEVHQIAARLLEAGVVPAEFNILLNQNRSPSFIRLLSTALSRIEMPVNGKIAYSYLMLSDFSQQEEDETEGMIEYLGMMEPVSVYFIIKEKKEGFYTASLRSKHHVDVSKVAAVFGGGGHMRAAGCRTDNLGLEAFKTALISEISKQL